MRNFECDSITRSELNGVTDKLAWANIVEAALTADRLVVCKRDPDANAVAPFSTGTIFRQLRSVGPFTTVSGTITKLGQLHTQSTNTAADIFTGSLVMQIQRVDGTRWIRGTMGPSKAAQNAKGVPVGAEQVYDFEVEKNFTSSNGFGVKANFAISGARFLASGVGTGAPAKADAGIPHLIEVWNWTNAASPTLAGSATLDTRIDDWVYEDADMAQEVGDAAIYQSSQVASLAEFDFAPTLLISDKHNNETSAVARWELIVASAVSRTRSTWTTYPGMDTFNAAQHVTIPPAFKVVVKDKAGTVLYTHAMHDGRPINAKRARGGDWTATSVLEPNYTTGMELVCWSDRPKKSSRADRWFPGLNANSMRLSRSHSQVSAIAVEPLITGGYGGNSKNGLHNLWAAFQWPQTRSNQNPQPRDPYGVVDTEYNRSGASAESGPWATGWGYEPGAFGGHNWYTGPGGPRFDRGPMPSILALWSTDPEGIRPQQSVPYKEMAAAWALNYANHSNHWVTDPRTLQLASNNTELLNEWDIIGQYYGDSGQKGPKVIDTRGSMRDGENAFHLDKNSQFFWMGWARDGLHSYGTAGWPALLMNSHMMAVMSKWDTFWQLRKGGSQGRSDYMVRSQAWLWLHYAIGWKLASKHRLGISREQIETMLQNHLESLYENIYVPVYVNNEDSLFANGLRGWGQPIQNSNGVQTQGGGLGMYMGNVLALWKQIGLWSKMYSRNAKCKQALDMQLKHMDKYAFDYTLDTSMEGWPTSYINIGTQSNWAQTLPKNGLADAVRNPDGSIRSGDRDVSMHPFSTYIYVRKHYFPEFPHPRLDAAYAKWEDMLGAVAANVAAGATPSEQRNRDHTYGYPGVSIWKPPAAGQLGPA
jgi:hypothetical protein